MAIFKHKKICAAVGCASVVLAIGFNVCSADINKDVAPKDSGTDFGVLSSSQTVDIFLYNDGDQKRTITFSNAIAADDPSATAVSASEVPDKLSLRNGLCTNKPQLFTTDDPYVPKGKAEQIKRNYTYAKLGKGQDTRMWIGYRDEQGKDHTEHLLFRKVCGNDELQNTIIMALVCDDGEPICTEEQAIQLDHDFGTCNPYDHDGLSIRKRVNSTVGTEWVEGGGKDGTSKLIIALSGNGKFSDSGYTEERDCFDDDKYSNKGEIVYVGVEDDPDMWDINYPYVLSTLAHEYQHMCHNNQRYYHNGRFDGDDEGALVSEGLSVLIEELTGLGLDVRNNGQPEPGIREHATYWDYFLKQCWVYRFGDFWGNEDAQLGGTEGGSYGKSIALMRYIYDNFGVSTVTRIAKGINIAGQAYNDDSTDGIEMATGYDFSQIALGTLIAGTGYTNAPHGMSYKELRFGQHWVTNEETDDDGNQINEMMTINPLVAWKKIKVKDLLNTKFTVVGHSGGYIRVMGDNATQLVLQHSKLGEDVSGCVIVSDDQVYDRDLSIRLQ